jgi:hypothetical protein
MSAAEFRKALRSAVRRQWTEQGFELQENLKSWARKNIEEAYELCAAGPASKFKECLEKAAKDAKVSEEYRRIWGK